MRIIFIALVFVFGCTGNFGTYDIEQDITDGFRTTESYHRTIVWHNRKILTSWYDPISSSPDSIAAIRYKQAVKYVEKCKKIESLQP